MTETTRPIEHADSFWAATADPGEPRPSLASEVRCDVAVVGGGFTGLSAAYHLRSLGLDVAVLEGNRVGWGASGRNGGHLLIPFKHGFSWISEQWGLPAARAMLRMSLSAIGLLKEVVRENRIDCSLVESGNLWAAHKPKYLDKFEREREFLERHLDYDTWVLGKKQMPEELATDVYHGVHVDPHGASFHPLGYALGLAVAAETAGATIYEGTEVRAARAGDGGVEIETSGGRVLAGRMVVATNGYTGPLVPELQRSVAAVTSNIIVTERLSGDLLRRIIPEGRVTSDTRRLLHYFRPTPDGRLLFGGSGGTEDLRKSMVGIFPELAGVGVEYGWGGKVAITMDMFPHIGTTTDGHLFALGYCGRGAALSTLMGKLLALDAAGHERERYPLEDVPLPRIPLHRLRGMGVGLTEAYYSVLDRFA